MSGISLAYWKYRELTTLTRRTFSILVRLIDAFAAMIGGEEEGRPLNGLVVIRCSGLRKMADEAD